MSRLKTLPGDDVRQIMWRFAERFDLQMAVQSSRSVARGPVAQLVANGARNSHDWTEEKNSLLELFDSSGITSIFMDPEHGGYIMGPKNLALALAVFEIAWVDAGAATCSMAGNLALSPIHERGTDEQVATYMSAAAPPQPGEDRKVKRGAFALTEPLPYVGVDTGVVSGKLSVAEWNEGEEPILQVEKRGRFITGMGFADFVTAAVDTADERIKSSCMVILEEGDEGTYDRGAPTLKMVHQLSSTSDPVFSLKVPASRIIGGYTVKDGVIVPNLNHSEIIAAVFNHTRVSVGLMSAAKLLSAIEPIIRYHRTRFRGGDASQPGTPRYELGIQQKEDAVLRTVDVWAMGEASASLGFEAARVFDVLDPLEKQKFAIFNEKGITSARAQMKELRKIQKEVVADLDAAAQSDDPLIQFVLADAEANVLCPACKLWCTGQGATVMREAVALMGGYGITEDCPGFLMHKWGDIQLEATYEGPEAVQRRQLSVTMTNPVFLAKAARWADELDALDAEWPELGAGSIAKGFRLWLNAYDALAKVKDANGKRLYHGTRHGVTFSMADAMSWLLASRCLINDTLELREKGPMNPVVAEGLEGYLSFYADLNRVQGAKAASECARILNEIMYGYASFEDDVLDAFSALRLEVDKSVAGVRIAKERAGQSVASVMIPEALDYPM